MLIFISESKVIIRVQDFTVLHDATFSLLLFKCWCKCIRFNNENRSCKLWHISVCIWPKIVCIYINELNLTKNKRSTFAKHYLFIACL